eukprot:15712123-Heterocapsa_arctica.AAC.1
MAIAGTVRPSLWVKPYYRETMSHDHKAKDLLFLVCTIGVAFPQFGTHKLSLPDESIVDLIH